MVNLTRSDWVKIIACSILCGLCSLVAFGELESWTSLASIARGLAVTAATALFIVVGKSFRHRRALAEAADPALAAKANKRKLAFSIIAFIVSVTSVYSQIRKMTRDDSPQREQSIFAVHYDTIGDLMPDVVPKCLPGARDLPSLGQDILFGMLTDVVRSYVRWESEASKMPERIRYHVTRAERELSAIDFQRFSAAFDPRKGKEHLRCLYGELHKSLAQYEKDPRNWTIRASAP